MKNILYNHYEIRYSILKIADIIRKENFELPPPILICILNGAFMFFTDLVKEIPDCEIDFIRVKSYDGQKQGKIKFLKNIELDIEGRNVYIIDDIFDTGNTIKSITKKLKKFKPKSITPVVLIKRKTSPRIDKLIYGFEIEDEWICGYGMDDENGLNRNKSYIYFK